MAATETNTSHPNSRDYATVVIANGASLSGAANLTGKTLVGIIMPATWTAANLTFQGSHDGTTYNDIYDDTATERTVQAAASRFLQVSPVTWLGINFLKVRSGTSGVAVNQGAARDVILVLAP